MLAIDVHLLKNISIYFSGLQLLDVISYMKREEKEADLSIQFEVNISHNSQYVWGSASTP